MALIIFGVTEKSKSGSLKLLGVTIDCNSMCESQPEDYRHNEAEELNFY